MHVGWIAPHAISWQFGQAYVWLCLVSGAVTCSYIHVLTCLCTIEWHLLWNTNSARSFPPRKEQPNIGLYRQDKLIELARALMSEEIEMRANTDRKTLGKSAVDALHLLKQIADDPIRTSADRLSRKQATQTINLYLFVRVFILVFILFYLQTRCVHCPRKSDRKTKTACDVCSKAICHEHMSVLCNSCLPQLPELPAEDAE